MEKKTRKLILYGIAIVSLAGGSTHFLFELSGRSVIAGIFVPVNESVWEHLKMTFWPLLIFWILLYVFHGKETDMPASSWSFAGVVSIYTCNLFILSFFYTYTGALGIESLAVDIVSLFAGIALGQLLALKTMKARTVGKTAIFVSLAAVAVLASLFIIFTFSPPRVPMFMDSQTGSYGIN